MCGGDGVDDVLGGLERLAEHSLVVSELGSVGDRRMRMLETIREFAAAKLAESPDEEELRERHSCYFEDWMTELRSQVGRRDRARCDGTPGRRLGRRPGLHALAAEAG